MALQFNPPEWLLQEYVNRQGPWQVAEAGIKRMSDEHLRYDEARRRTEAITSEIANRKETNRLAGEQIRQKGYDQFADSANPAFLPANIRAGISNPVEGPVTPDGQSPAEDPIVAYSKQLIKDTGGMGYKGLEAQKTLSEADKNRAMADYYRSGGRGAAVPGGTPKGPKAPTGFQWKDESFSELVPIPGGPATIPTEGQANARLYASRTEEADKILNDLSSQNDFASVSSGIQGKLPNIAKSKEIQMFEQAKRNFLNAVLRRESGAVISPTEFAEGNKQYFDVMGDSEEVKQQKRLNRQTAIAGLRNASGVSSSVPVSQPAQGKTSADPLGIR